MRIQCNLLPFFLLGLVVTSIVEASGGKKHKKKGKKGKKRSKPQVLKTPPLSILDDESAEARHEVLVSQTLTEQPGKRKHDDYGSLSKSSDSSSFIPLNSSSMDMNVLLPSPPSVSPTSDLSFFNPSLKSGLPSSSTLELSKQKDRKINIDTIHSSSSSSSFLSSASEGNVAQDVIDALQEKEFGRMEKDWGKWRHRKDLFDQVVTKSVKFIIEFINQVDGATRYTLAALFVKRPDVVDQVLEKIEYDDYQLWDLTTHRPELAEPKSHKNFFKMIDKIKSPIAQEGAVGWGVFNLFETKKHSYVIPLINALENIQFNGRTLEDVAIQMTFKQGAQSGITYFVEKFYDHLAITHDEYVFLLIRTWVIDKSRETTFPFLLIHADQGDLKRVENYSGYHKDSEFRGAIDNAFSKAKPAGSRHIRFLVREMVKLAMNAFSETADIQSLDQEERPRDIILGYLGELEGTEGGKGQ
jgi:hypothetical protein